MFNHYFFFLFVLTAVPTFPPPPSSMCTQPANWMCVKDPELSSQVFTFWNLGILEDSAMKYCLLTACSIKHSF